MNSISYILLINRERKFLEATRDSLRNAGYSVLTATDMSSALSELTYNAVGLIICDNLLQDIGGYDFLQFLKNDPLWGTIPFVFFVPVHDQGRAFKAFEIGASDFIVYPLDAKVFIERIREIKPSQDHIEQNPTAISPVTEASIAQSSKTVVPAREERRESERRIPLPPLHIEISRDGILWMPGQIKNISGQGIFVETPLLGKSGILLNIKVPSANGIYILKGYIQHITFSNPQHSAGIGIEMEDTNEWREVHDHIAMLMGAGNLRTEDKSNGKKNSSMQIARKTVILPYQQSKAPAHPLLLNIQGTMSEEALDVRFYHGLVGKQLGNYKAVSFIGSGSMGGVFKGWDTALERTVALKVISYELSSHETFRDMFIKEARLISQLDHPNIALIYYIGHTDDILYFAMEFISGGNLADMIKEHHDLNTLKGLKYFITVCRTLDFVSRKNIIHRDIKPENIMINDKGILKIVDFGVAKSIDGNTKETKPDNIVGSPLYMSPDCIQGCPLDCRSDIYSLGATFYHAFTGSPPFEGKNTEDVFLKHLNGDLVPLKKKNPKVSDSLGKIIERMMARNSEDRYQNYENIIEDLDSLIS